MFDQFNNSDVGGASRLPERGGRLGSQVSAQLGASPGSDVPARTTAAAAVRMHQVLRDAEARVEDRPVGFIARAFPTAEVRARLTGQAKMTAATMENRLRVLANVHEAERKVMLDVLNAVRGQHAAHLRGQLATSMQHELTRVVETFDQAFERFTQTMVARIEAAERLPIEALREREVARIFSNYDALMEMREKLLENFRRIVDEQVDM